MMHDLEFATESLDEMELDAPGSDQQEVLQELYESSELLNEGLLSFEYPLLVAEDEELDLFLGKLIRRAGRAAGGLARTVGKGISAVSKVVPMSTLTSGLAMTPLGMAFRAGLGAVQAAAEGRNVFQSAMRTLASTPGMRFLVDTGLAAARGENIAKAAQKAMQAGIGDVRQSVQFAAMVAPFVPGIGTGVGAALGAANALASGQPITDALIAGARNALPGGAIAQTAFDTAVNLAKGKNVGDALLNSVRSKLPGGPAAQAAFDAAVALAKGKSIQDAAFAATGRLLPRSPYAADALSFVRKVASGQNIQRAALSGAGNFIMNKIQQQTGVSFPKAGTRISSMPSKLAASQFGRAAAATRARLPFHEMEAMDELEHETQESGESGSSEGGTEDRIFGETEEMQLAAELLEITDEKELDGFIGALIARATDGAQRLAASSDLRALLRQAAQRALPMLGGAGASLVMPRSGGPIGSRLTAAAGNLFGLELEGLSPEDQEFEVARRFVRFAGAGARNASRYRGRIRSPRMAQRALGAAARRYAPGFFSRPRPRPRPASGFGPVVRPWPVNEPNATTCRCCGAPLPGATGPVPDAVAPNAVAPDTAADGSGDGGDKTLPDNEPATSTDTQPQNPKGTDMHDLDRTTMEISDEAGDFEFSESQDEYGEQTSESPFSEEEESELAAELLEINDEQELDQFLGSLLRKAKSVVGGALKSPLLQPLGGLLKGAIKKVLPIAGGALGNLVAPGFGGQIGSRLASSAGDLLGLEYENAAPEDQEFEVAKRLVRMAGTAVQTAAQSPNSSFDPQAAAKAAIMAAAKAHVPGLLQSQYGSDGGPHHHHHRPRSGRWFRRNKMIVLMGV
jgi:hypothetical protein